MWRKGSPCALLVELQTGTATKENSMDLFLLYSFIYLTFIKCLSVLGSQNININLEVYTQEISRLLRKIMHVHNRRSG